MTMTLAIHGQRRRGVPDGGTVFTIIDPEAP
jgi:hypothetical protein